MPVESMHYTISDHYSSTAESMPITDARQFDSDLRRIFLGSGEAPAAQPASAFVQRHLGEIVNRISFWSGEPPSVVRSLMDHVIRRAAELDLRLGLVEAATLVELTAFGTAVAMLHRASRMSRRRARPRDHDAGAVGP
jgi:hypothetical protein